MERKLPNARIHLIIISLASSDKKSKWFFWVIIICSKFDCSKNLLDTILLLLDTIRAIIIFLVNCSKIMKNHLPYVYFEQFHF